jgi:hypothetical protein
VPCGELKLEVLGDELRPFSGKRIIPARRDRVVVRITQY